MPSMTDIATRTTDPIDLAETCLTAAIIHADRAAEARDSARHSASGVEREHQRYYMKRAEVHAMISQASSLQRIADALDRLALSR